jgi:hypothetical protein
MRFVYLGQQLDVSSRVQAWKAASAIRLFLDTSLRQILTDQTCRLGPAQPCHLGQVASQQPLLCFALVLILLCLLKVCFTQQ